VQAEWKEDLSPEVRQKVQTAHEEVEQIREVKKNMASLLKRLPCLLYTGTVNIAQTPVVKKP